MSQFSSFIASATGKEITICFRLSDKENEEKIKNMNLSPNDYTILADEDGVWARSKNEQRKSLFIPLSSILWASH